MRTTIDIFLFLKTACNNTVQLLASAKFKITAVRSYQQQPYNGLRSFSNSINIVLNATTT